MIFDYLGLPRDVGATDFKDSARLAGIMEIVQYPKTFNIWQYVDINGQLCRHPMYHEPKDFSRDQLLPLAAGLYSKRFQVVDKPYVLNTVDHKWWLAPNGDFMSPSHRNHIALCACDEREGAMEPNRFGYLWLRLDILWNAYVQPLSEPNQLIAMMIMAGPQYVRLWKKHNKKWDLAIRQYWSEGAGAWREERDLAAWMIDFIESY